MTWKILGEGAVIFFSSVLGTWGFAMLLHAPKKAWLPSSLIGGVAYTLYWSLMQLGMAESAAIFLGALAGSVLAQYCARRMRMIATVFLLLSIIALVPGLGLYRCMHFLAQEMYAEGMEAGVRAMVGIVMIALGFGAGSYLFRLASGAANRRKEANP